MQPQPKPGDLLDMLCMLRGLYAHRGVDDSRATLSIEAAVVYGERLLRVAHIRDGQRASGNTNAPRELS